ncbi:MAG: transglutaminase domain-containing protein [Candidatus Thorarchaeota archaeon]
MSAEGKTRKRMGITAIISSIFIVATIVWGFYSFALIQFGEPRIYDPHYEYDEIEYWPYTHDFAGSEGSWFDNLNYTDFNLDLPLPEDLLDMMNEPVFYVAPADPGQLWRIESYDQYDGASWTKTSTNAPRDLVPGVELIPSGSGPNEEYHIFFNATAGAEVGTISLPSLFPSIRVIEDSFETYSVVDDQFIVDDPTRLLYYDLQTDDYGTLLFSPLIDGTTGEDVLVSFAVTFVYQDLDLVQTTAQSGILATVDPMYRDLSLVQPLSQRVLDDINQFSSVGTNAYEKALAVQVYFQSTFELNLTQEALLDRPDGQEITDWFLERGNGLPMDFATAYCVFMRELGVPSRVITGYALGEPHSSADMRTVMVRHMTFWAEVFIPMSGHIDGGEWIQVIPTPLPDDMGGGEDPGNTPIPELELLVGPTGPNYWAETGTPFGLYANISVDGVFITTPDTIYFYDETDSVAIGPATIGGTMPPPNANITHTFPYDATNDFHTITASWMNSYFTVTNATRIYAVGTPIPMAHETSSVESPDAIIAETQELDINQGLDTYVTLWEDTVHVFGIMTVGGNPVNGSNLQYNPYIQIMWDDVIVGDALIRDDGYYELDVYVDPLDFALMTVGQHDVYSSYAGDWDPIGEFYRLLPANSTFTSVVTVYGTVGFEFSVTPTDSYAGGTLTYDGRIYFMNGSLLPSGQSVGTFFDSQANGTQVLNATGGFQWTYIIPGAQSDGTYSARANWTSPYQYIAGNWSITIDVTVGAGGSQIALVLLPDPVFIGETYTIWGYLQYASNSSGIGSQWVDVYWSAGSTTYIGSSFTAADGYFEVIYQIPAGYEGAVTYWANFTSPLIELADTESFHIGTTVKRYDVDITIYDNPDPIHLLQTVTIQGIASMPENASYPLISETVELYWANSTYPGGILIDTTTTNSTGGYVFYYQIPLSHSIETVTVWVHFTSPYTNIADGESIHEPLTIDATNTLLTVYSDFPSYYLNETVQITGNLQFVNGTPIAFQTVYIHWYNSTGPWVFEELTDINGDYSFQYNLSVNMGAELVDVLVNWTSWTMLYADAFADLEPEIQLNRYDLVLTLTVPTEIYVDENLVIQGVLETSGGTPIVGATIVTAYWNGSNWLGGFPITNSSGGFASGPLPFATLNEENILCVAYYESTDPMVNNITQYFYVDRVKYAINIEITLLPNPDTVMQNETLTVCAYLYFSHNSTPVVNALVDIWWNNGTVFWLGNIITNGTGQGDLLYSGMAYDTFRIGIQVYGNYTGTILRSANESVHTLLTLEQWESELVGLFTPVTVYSLLDTITVSGALRYVTPSIPYASVTVELLLDGTPIDSTTTALDGSFVLSWAIPSDTPTGFYDLEVRYVAPVPWILGKQELVANIEITAPGYDFPSFTVSPESPTPVIVLDYLTITGIVTWDNGSPYAFSSVELWWNLGGTDSWMKDVMTNGAGAFSTTHQVPGGTTPGIAQVWAYIPAAGIVTSGMSLPRTIDIQTHSLTITASVDVTLAHLGDTITISGTAHFTNGTPLTGYTIEIWWHSTLWSTEFVDGTGSFSYGIVIPYDEAVGVHPGYVYFTAPTAAFSDVQVDYQDVETREYIYLFMGTIAYPNTYSRGDTVTITGYVTNDDGVPLPVQIRALVDGGTTTSTDYSDAGTGVFSIQWSIPAGQPGGPIVITVDSISPFRDVVSLTGSWSIIIVIDSVLLVQATTASFMPGESFNIQLQLYDDDGNPINGASIEIRLDNTLIATITLANGAGQNVSVTIPASWSSDGYFAITAEFAGATYLNGDTDVSADSIHVFTEIIFNNRAPSRVNPGQTFTIEVLLTDSEQNPIIERPVRLNINGTLVPLTTDSEGIITYDQPGYGEGILRFSVTLTSPDVSPIASGAFEISIQTQGGIILQGIDLIIAGILLVGAVIAVLAYLYIVKGMFRSVVISRGIDIPTKLRNIKKLADAGKYGASITLAYRTFEQMCGSKMGSERTHSETAREYLDRVLQSIPLDGPTIEQFVQTYEEARFSHHEMTRDRYEAALRIFTDLYPRIDTSAPME